MDELSVQTTSKLLDQIKIIIDDKRTEAAEIAKQLGGSADSSMAADFAVITSQLKERLDSLLMTHGVGEYS